VLAVTKYHAKLCHGSREPEPVGGFTGLFYVRTNRCAEEFAGQRLGILVTELDVAELAGGIFRERA